MSYLSEIPTNALLNAAIIFGGDAKMELPSECFPSLMAAFTNVQAISGRSIPRDCNGWTLELLGTNPSGLTKHIPFYRLFCIRVPGTDDALVFYNPIPEMAGRSSKAVLVPGLGRFSNGKTKPFAP